MRKLVFVLLCIPLLAFAQRQVTVTAYPLVNPTIIDSLVLTSGQDTITIYSGTVDTDLFDSASVTGVRVFGGGLPYGATVTEWIDSSSIILSDTITAAGADTLATLTFEYFTSVQYGSGDAMGFQNRLTLPSGVNTAHNFRLVGLTAADTSEQGANFEILFFSGSIAQGTENAAVALPIAAGVLAIGAVTVDTWTDYGDYKLGFEQPTIYLPQGGQYFYQLVSRGTATYTGPYPFKLQFVFLVD